MPDVDLMDAPAIAPRAAQPQGRDVLDELIASHRAALRELAPQQEEHAARVEAGWHMERLGLLLRQRDAARAAMTLHPALVALRAGQPARVRAGIAYREACGDPVENLSTLLALPQSMPPGEPEPKAAAGAREADAPATAGRRAAEPIR